MADKSSEYKPLTAETERIVAKLRANKQAFELLFEAHGVRPMVSYAFGEAISRLCKLDVDLQELRKKYEP